MKTNILNGIYYPGGGVAYFDYEVHKFAPQSPRFGNRYFKTTSDHELSEGGGLRVKRIIMKTSPFGTIARQVDYTYSEANVRALPLAETFMRVHNTKNSFSVQNIDGSRTYNAHGLECRLVALDPFSHYMDKDFGEIPIWYSHVTETTAESTTDYYFADSEVKHNDFDDTVFGRRTIKALNRIADSGPRLTRKVTTTGKNTEEELYYYDVITAPTTIVAADIHRELIQYVSGGREQPDFDNGYLLKNGIESPGLGSSGLGDYDILLPNRPAHPYSIHKYTVTLSKERLRETVTIKSLSSLAGMRSSRRIKYVSDAVSTIDSIIEENGRISKISIFEYPKNNSEMTSLGVTAIPVKVTEIKEGRKTFTTADYVNIGKRGFKPRKVYRWHEGGDTVPSPLCVYDRYGNLNEAIDPDGVRVAYFYGHNYSLPVIKVEGVNRNTAASLAGYSTEAGNFDKALIRKIDGALVTALSYHPHRGVTSLRTPAGVTSRYSYDKAGRLTETSVDGIGILEKYNYDFTAESGITVSTMRWLDDKGSQMHTTETHYDGLGRKSFDYDRTANISVHTQYDKEGRVKRVSMPVTNDYAPVDSGLWTDYKYIQGIGTKEFRPGKEWRDNNRSIYRKNSYLTKSYSGRIPKFEVGADGSITIPCMRPDSSVYSVWTSDENQVTIEEASDGEGRLLLRHDGHWKLQTHYIYDDFGRLRYILPPNVEAKAYAANDPVLLNEVYAWQYDGADRVVRQRVPGQKESRFIYTPGGRLAAEWGGLIPDGLWRLHSYDKFGREVLTGTAALTEAQARSFAATAVAKDYGNPTLPALYALPILPGGAVFTPETATVYDSYDALSLFDDSSLSPDNSDTYLATPAGLSTLTASRTSAGNYIYTSIYYDTAGRVSRERTLMPDAAMTRSCNYHYHGPLQTENFTVELADTVYKLSLIHGYNAAEKPSGVWAATPTGLATTEMHYGKFGLLSKTYFGEKCRQDFEYIDRGWIKKNVINVPMLTIYDPIELPNLHSQGYYGAAAIDSVFFQDDRDKDLTRKYTEELFYADAPKPSYNGAPGARRTTKGGRYEYAYNTKGFLTRADYTPGRESTEDYSTSYTYDDLGRPLTIKRWGVLAYDGSKPFFGPIDDMSLSYSGPVLESITDNTSFWDTEGLPDEAEYYGMAGYPGSGFGDTYAYAFNNSGLLEADEARGLTDITYDSFGNLRSQTRAINQKERYEERFEYSPSGARLRHTEVHIGPARPTPGFGGSIGSGTILPGTGGGLVIPDAETVLADRRYIGPFTFSADTLERIDFPGGYFDHTGKPFYMIRDWNASVAMVVDETGRVKQHTGYYPYGEPWDEPTGQPYLYAGKERMRFLSRGDSDFGPRSYNAAVALWWAPDRLAADTPWFSPYTYCGANPNLYSDLSGNRISATGEGHGYYWQYINNKWDFYNDKGEAYAGTGFVCLVRDALNYLMEGETGNALISRIADDDRDVAIYSTKKGEGSRASSSGIGWDTQGVRVPTESEAEPNAYIDLGHEFGHIDLSWFGGGINDKKKWFIYYDAEGNLRVATIGEIHATHVENKLRSEHNLPLRVSYVITVDTGQKMGRIIKNNSSLYFDINENTNFKPLRGKQGYEYKRKK